MTGLPLCQRSATEREASVSKVLLSNSSSRELLYLYVREYERLVLGRSRRNINLDLAQDLHG
jgi:hypothetical protein